MRYRPCVAYLALMSRGFVKEDDQEEAPFIPPRAPLPDGVDNYVTPAGLKALHAEREALDAERSAAYESDDARRRAWAVIDGKLALLEERIATAKVVEPTTDGPNTVRFGSTVTVLFVNGPQAGMERTFTIVGVDEASVKDGKIGFLAPIAKALIGKRVGRKASYPLGATKQELKVLAVAQS